MGTGALTGIGFFPAALMTVLTKTMTADLDFLSKCSSLALAAKAKVSQTSLSRVSLRVVAASSAWMLTTFDLVGKDFGYLLNGRRQVKVCLAVTPTLHLTQHVIGGVQQDIFHLCLQLYMVKLLLLS